MPARRHGSELWTERASKAAAGPPSAPPSRIPAWAESESDSFHAKDCVSGVKDLVFWSLSSGGRPTFLPVKKIRRDALALIIISRRANRLTFVAAIRKGGQEMKTALGLIVLVALIAPCARGQTDELAYADGFFGFSLLHAISDEPILTNTSYGGVGTLGWNINERIGIEAEFGGYHNGTVNAYHSDTNSVTYLFGPRLSYGRLRRFDPYFHVLLGGIHTATGVLNQPAVNPLIVQETPARHTVSQNGFTLAIGGGMDIRLNKYVSFRPIQVDYLPMMLSNIGPNGLTNNSFRSTIRYSVGFMFQDYEH